MDGETFEKEDIRSWRGRWPGFNEQEKEENLEQKPAQKQHGQRNFLLSRQSPNLWIEETVCVDQDIDTVKRSGKRRRLSLGYTF